VERDEKKDSFENEADSFDRKNYQLNLEYNQESRVSFGRLAYE